MILFIIISLFLVGCNYYIDVPVALFIQRTCYTNSIWFSYTSDLPDTLLLVVVVTTAGAYAGYRTRACRNIFDAMTRFYLLIAVALPVSYGVKDIAKFICGRVTTRCLAQGARDLRFSLVSGEG